MATMLLIPMLYTTAYGTSTPAIISSPLTHGSESINVSGATREVKSAATQTDGSSNVTDRSSETDNGVIANVTIQAKKPNTASQRDSGVSNVATQTYLTRQFTGNDSQGSSENVLDLNTTSKDNLTATHLTVNSTELTTKPVPNDPNVQISELYNMTFLLEVYETYEEDNTSNPPNVFTQTASSRKLKAEWLLCIPALITCAIFFL
ncbi:b121.3 [miniopterid betaherpesvirus 1]|uniref:B121.3 n=1 Tax=miniopterid betaherpesvirus 1 TaxID=3070189 RepID=I3VQB4_9BETA|nr:b121.3 [miniopterid betaherpesvirus 1]AFK83958.1 b121.3 [miniopterid betaherpesvirus 1]